MDRRARTAGIASSLSDQEILDRAAIDADLPGILRAYGWRAVRGEDAHARRVLTDSEGIQRIVVSRHSETHCWQWWDTAVNVVGDIVDALRLLIGCRSLRDVIVLLRRALDDPPGPLPVSEATDRHAASNHVIASFEAEQPRPLEEPYHDLSPRVPELDHAVDSMLSETGVESGDEPVASDTETVSDQAAETENISEVAGPEDSLSKPPKRGARRR